MEDLSMTMSIHDNIKLIINPTSHKFNLRKNTPIVYIEEDLEQHLKLKKKSKQKLEELDELFRYTEKIFDISLFDINPKLPKEQNTKVAKLLYKYRDVFAYKQDNI